MKKRLTRRKRKTVIFPKADSPSRGAWFLLALFLLLALPSQNFWIRNAAAECVLAQNAQEKPYALIIGTVWGPDDRAVYGIKVKIRRASETKARWELSSNHTGEFAQRVPAGKDDYVVWADLKGVKTKDGKELEAEEVTVHIENDERSDVSLHLKVQQSQ